MNPIYFVPEVRHIPLYGDRSADYAYHLCELVPFYQGSEVSDVIPIDTVRYAAGDIYRTGTYSSNTWTLDWGAPWDVNKWTANGSHEFVDPAGNRYPITGNSNNTLTITVGGTPPLDGTAFIAPKKIYLNSTDGFANKTYAFGPGGKIVRAIAIAPESSTIVRVYGVGGLSTNPWVENQFNASPSGFSKYLLIDSNRGLYKITNTAMGVGNYNSPYHYAKLTLSAVGGASGPSKGPALIFDSAGFIEYSGVGYDQSRKGYLNAVTLHGGFVPKNATIIGAPFESRKERGEAVTVGWLGTTTDVTVAGKTVTMASRMKMVLNDKSSSDWVGNFVDTTSSEITLINDPTPEDIIIRRPEYFLPTGYVDQDITTSTDLEVQHQFIVSADYDPGTPVAAYIWWAVPSNYNPDIEIPFEDTGAMPIWIPKYDAHYDIYLKVVGTNGAETNAVKITIEPIVITGRSTDFPWGPPTIDIVDFDEWNRAMGTLASVNFDGNPDDLLDEGGAGTEGLAIDFDAGVAVMNNIIARGSGIIGGWVIEYDRLYDATNHIELNAAEERIKVNDGTEDRAILGKVGTDYGLQVNDDTGTEVIGLYGTTANMFGWTAIPSALYKDDGSDSVGMSSVPGAETVAFWAGDVYANRADAPYRVLNNGEIQVGDDTDYIIIDGPDQEIRNSTFAAGTSGWRITSAGSGTAEFNDIIARGSIIANILVFQETAVTRGTILVTHSAGELWSSWEAGGSNSINITKTASTESSAPFVDGDFCLVNNGLKKTWIEIMDNGTTHTGYWTFTTTNKSDPSNGYVYPAGSAVADYGVAGDGGVEITADKGTAPYVDIFKHGGAPWASITSVGRIGNMDGYMGISGDSYGFGFGAEYPSGQYIRYDSASGGLVVAGNFTIINTAAVKASLTIIASDISDVDPYNTSQDRKSWGWTTVNMPDSPSGTGFFATGEEFGLFKDGDWRVFFNNSGDMHLGNTAGDAFQYSYNDNKVVLKTGTGSNRIVFDGPNNKITFVISGGSASLEPDVYSVGGYTGLQGLKITGGGFSAQGAISAPHMGIGYQGNFFMNSGDSSWDDPRMSTYLTGSVPFTYLAWEFLGDANSVGYSFIFDRGAVYIDDGLHVDANITLGSGKTVDGVDISALNAKVGGVTEAEMNQVENIGTKTISNDQWGYLSILNQNLRTTDNVNFAKVTITGQFVMDAGTGSADGIKWGTDIYIYRTSSQKLRIDSGVRVNKALGVGTNASIVTGEIRATNNIIAYYSDERLKDVQGVIENPIEKLLQIRGVYYTENKFSEQFGYHDKTQKVGIIAQDVKKVFPEAIEIAPFDSDSKGNSISGQNYMTVQYDRIVPLLIESIKAQQIQIDSQQKEIDSLKSAMN